MAIELPGSSSPGPLATWRSLDAEICGPVRGSGDFRRSLRRYEPHDGAIDGAHGRPASEAPASAPAPRASRRPEGTGEVDLFTTAYAPEAGTPGGTIIIGDWQEATQFNPYYLSQVTEANVASLVWHSLLTITNDFRYYPQLAAEPIPTTANGGVTVGEGGDAMTVTWKLRDGLKWSDGEPLTCDDFKYAWEWVLDRHQHGRHHGRLGGHHRTSSAPPTPT